jgi:poly(A) polymerase
LTHLLIGQRPSEGLHWLSQTGLLPLVLPEAAALINFHRSSRHHHKDVWDHTRQVVRQAVPRPTVRWAALLHDIGKVHTRSYGPKRTVHFLLHDELGAQMTEGVMTRLRFPAAQAQRIEALVRLHLRANFYVPQWSDAAIRRFVNEAGESLEELLLLSRADITSKRPGKRRAALHTLNELQTRIEAVQTADALRKPRVPKGLGKLIITELGVKPGPKVGELRAACDAAARDGRLPPEPSMDECLAFLRTVAQVA